MIRIVAVGKLKEKALIQLIDEYRKRLTPFTKLEIVEVSDEHAPQTNSAAENELVKERESKRLLAQIKEGEYVILLDLWGKMYDSVRFSQTLERLWTQGTSTVTFVIAGSLGPSEAIVKRSDLRWKLSDLTFTHQMTRLLVIEQIYRAYMISSHRPYHK